MWYLFRRLHIGTHDQTMGDDIARFSINRIYTYIYKYIYVYIYIYIYMYIYIYIYISIYIAYL